MPPYITHSTLVASPVFIMTMLKTWFGCMLNI